MQTHRASVIVVLPTLLLVLAFVHAGYGQATTGSVDVRVTDPTGDPIPGVEILVVPKVRATGSYLVGTTNEEGNELFVAVKPGKHSLEFRRSGFGVEIVSVNIFAGISLKLTVVLHPADYWSEGLTDRTRDRQE